MTLDILSKHCIIIGIFALLASLAQAIAKIPDIVEFYENFEDVNYYRSNFLQNQISKICVAVFAAILSILLIVGVIKKRPIFVGLWFVSASIIYLFLTFSIVYDTVSRITFHLDDYVFCIIVIGMGVIILHPIYHEALRDYRATRVQKNLKSVQNVLIPQACFEVILV